MSTSKVFHYYMCILVIPHRRSQLFWSLSSPRCRIRIGSLLNHYFPRLPLRRLRDHVQHPLPSSSITPLLQFPRSLSATERVGRCDPEAAVTWSARIPSMSVRQPPFTRDIAESGAPCWRAFLGPTREAHRGTPLPVISVHSQPPISFFLGQSRR